MLVTDLTQSPYLNVVNAQRLQELLTRASGNTPNDIDISVAVNVAHDAQIETVLAGRVFRNADDLVIEVELFEAGSGEMVRKEAVSGPGMEQIFSMMNELSNKVRTNLRGDLVAMADNEVQLSEMTHSIEAFRWYSEGLENRDKLLYAEAEKWFEKAVDADSTFSAAQLKLGEIKMALGKVDEAMKVLETSRRFAKKLSTSDELLLKFYEYNLNGDIANVLKTLEEFVAYAPYDIEIRMRLASFYRHLEEYDKAIQEYEAILELDPNRKLAYNELAYIYAGRGDFTTALKKIEKYAELAPDEPNPHDSHGEILMRSGRLDEAEEHFEAALAIRSDFMTSAENLVNLYSELGDLKQALHYSDESIKYARSPNEKTNSYASRARLLWRYGKIKDAEKSIKKAIASKSKSVFPFLVAGEMYQSIGDTTSARNLFQTFFDQNMAARKNNEWNVLDMGNFCLVSLEADLLPYEKVAHVLEDVIKTHDQDFVKEQFRQILATVYLRMGDSKKAKELMDGIDKGFYQYVVKLPNQNWTQVWKYISEWIDLEPIEYSPDPSKYDDLYYVAKGAGRKDIEVMSRYIFSQYQGKFGNDNELAAEYKALGTPLEKVWQIAGPYQNQNGFDSAFPPEKSKGAKDIKWKPASDGSDDGYINLRKIFNASSWAVAYAKINVYSPDTRIVQIRMGTDEACKLWLNNGLVWQAYRLGGVPLDTDIVKVMLHPGNNKILLKVTNSIRDWGFYFRITNSKGDGFPDLEFRSEDSDDLEMAITQ